MRTETLNGKTYKVSDSQTYYNQETPDNIVDILERIKTDKIRVRFHWGNIKTGEDWGDELDVKGTIGRSTGSAKIPILIHNKRSTGGGAILTHCIVKITETKGKKLIYQHPNYFLPEEKNTDYFRKSL